MASGKSETKLNKGAKAKKADFVFAIMVMILVIFGVIMVFSASNYDALNDYGDPYYYLKRAAMWAVLGAVAMAAMAALPYRIYYRLAPIIMVGSFVLLLLLRTPLGETRNNATRWLDFGLFTVMPGELAKVAAIIFVAWFLAREPERIRKFFVGVVPLLVLAGGYFCLIYLKPSSNLSTAITVCGIIFGMMFIAGMKWIHVSMIGCAAAVGVTALILLDEDGYQRRRLFSFLDPFADQQSGGYQVVQSLLALGAGGVFGVGLGKSIQKALYLPEGHNDFILAIIGEELGLVGCLLLLAAYIVLIWRGITIAIHARDRFGMLIAAGITVMIGLQVVLNIAVVTSSMPPTGVTLPFVSYGGNALLIYMALAGILLNVSRYPSQQEEKEWGEKCA